MGRRYSEGGGFEEKYAALSLIALFAVSVKLSVGMVILLAIYPLVKLVSLHDWKTIAKYFCIGMVIIIPFFIRNIIISGYMVYPYSKIDLFNVDWKMPSYTLDFDRYEIRAWGQGLKNVNRFNAGIHQWFPSWVKQLDGGLRMIFYLNVPCSIVGLIVGIWQIIKKKNVNYFIMICTMAASVLLWFHGAPLIRYGMCYLIILPLFMLGCMFSLIKKSSKIVIIAVAGVTLYHIRPLITADNSMSPVLKYNADYCILESDKLFLDGIEVYCPVGGDQAGYYNFPSTPYRRRLELIQLRGDSIQDGFRMKEEYKDELVTTYGKFARFNMFEMQFQDKDNEIRRRRKMVNYLEEINDPRYIIFMSVKEEGTNALTKEIKAGLEKLRLKTDLTGQFGRSYYAVISGDEIIEEISDIKLEAGGTVMDADISYSVVSAGYDCGCVSSIIIDGKEYSINSRGINIVIYNNETNQVVDTVCFDTSENLSEDRFAIH